MNLNVQEIIPSIVKTVRYRFGWTTILVDVPKGTKIRLTGEGWTESTKWYELRVELEERRVIRTYLLAEELDDLFFPENQTTRASMYNDFRKADAGIRMTLCKRYKITQQQLESLIGGLY
jgi:hypothetical protein